MRMTAGLICICLVFPPISVGVFGFFALLPGAVGAALIVWPVVVRFARKRFGKFAKPLLRVVYLIVCAALIFFAGEFCLIYNQSFAQAAPEKATLVVLGAQVEGKTPTIILRDRIKTAAVYLKHHPQTVCVASGGRGEGEDISEGQCIKNYLVNEYGVEPARVLVDDASFSTEQNIGNTLEIIEQNALPKDLVITTDGFHIYRSKIIAGRKGLRAFANPVQTDPRLVVCQYLRELFALPKTLLLDH